MKKASAAAERDRASSTGSIGSPGSFTIPSNGSKGSGIEAKIDWIIKTVKEIKSETGCKNEIKVMIKELGSVKQELENLKKIIQGMEYRPKEGMQRNYSEAIKGKKKRVL